MYYIMQQLNQVLAKNQTFSISINIQFPVYEFVLTEENHPILNWF